MFGEKRSSRMRDLDFLEDLRNEEKYIRKSNTDFDNSFL